MEGPDEGESECAEVSHSGQKQRTLAAMCCSPRVAALCVSQLHCISEEKLHKVPYFFFYRLEEDGSSFRTPG